MCGIAGYVNWTGEPVDREVLCRMSEAVRHRGPDDSGIFLDGPAGLAHRRLSIIDVEGGHQPMSNEEGAVWITFNGEIFNYPELRDDLKTRGHRFATRSDTEVILHAYEEYGERCVERFNGQWAFAIWDGPRRRLFLSRDRLGIRPLYYTAFGTTFAFASEIKGLFRHPGVRRELDLHGLDQTLTFWAPISPRTVFRGISELSPGHSMTIGRDGSRVSRYWALSYDRDPGRPVDDCSAAERLADLMTDATRIRLRADVPVGAYLSGGLDSGIVSSLARRCTDAPLTTFSISFDDPEFDESAHQHEMVRALGTSHVEMRCSYEDIARVFPDVVWHAEKPVLRTAPAPMYLLASLVREHGYKVVLTGEGADEMFGGYDLFKEAKIRRFCAAQPASRLRPLLLRRLYPYLPGVQAQSPAYLRAFFGTGPDEAADPLFSHLPRFSVTSRIKAFLSPDVRSALRGYDCRQELRDTLPEAYGRWDTFSQAQYLETTGLMPGYILSSQADRVSMAHAVEGRFPFLDHRVAELAAKLRARSKMRVLEEKYLLRRALGAGLPEGVRRRRKQPYRAPDARSFVARPGSSASAYVEDLMSMETVREYGVFSPDAVARLAGKLRSGRVTAMKDDMAFVGVLSTQLLVRRFIHDVQ